MPTFKNSRILLRPRTERNPSLPDRILNFNLFFYNKLFYKYKFKLKYWAQWGSTWSEILIFSRRNRGGNLGGLPGGPALTK